jgi:hypothetical protein
VRRLGRVDEAEVVAVFLVAELESDRFGPPIRKALSRDGVELSVVAAPDLADRGENAYRRELLGELRGWGRSEGLFGRFPDDVEWFRALLTPPEVASILYIDWDWWLMLSGGTRRPSDAAARIRAGEVEGSLEWYRAIAVRLRSGPQVPEMIVVRSTKEAAPLVVLEGHVRLTAFMLFPEHVPDELEVLLGESPAMEAWSNY